MADQHDEMAALAARDWDLASSAARYAEARMLRQLAQEIEASR